MSAEHITIVTNAADVIGWFDEAGKRYPYPGSEVNKDDILEVLETLGKVRTIRLLGWRGTHDDLLLRLETVSLEQQTITLADMGEMNLSGVYTIADEPLPKAAEFHGDLVYELRPYEPANAHA